MSTLGVGVANLLGGVVDALIEHEQARGACVAEVADAEEILNRGEQREVIVFAGDVGAAGLYVLRDQQQPDTSTSWRRGCFPNRARCPGWPGRPRCTGCPGCPGCPGWGGRARWPSRAGCPCRARR